MPTRISFLRGLLPLAFAVVAWSCGLPFATAQGDAPKSSTQNDNAESKDDAQVGDEQNAADKKDIKKKDTRKKDPGKADTIKKDTIKKDTEKRRTEKRAAKAQREPSAKGADGSRSSAKAPGKGSDAEREEAALALVREHHPALVELLERLKATKKADYQQAIKELYRDSQRLAAAQKRDADRYALELRAWQLDSRIRLLIARLSLEDRTELEEELKASLVERAEVRLSLKKLDRDRAAARAKKLNEEIEKLASGQDAEVNRTFERLLRAAKKAVGGRREASKNKVQAAATEEVDAARTDAPKEDPQSDRPLTVAPSAP